MRTLRSAVRRGAGGGLVLALAAGLLSQTALAHRLLYPKRNELVLRPRSVTATLRMSLDVDDSQALRDRYDRDGDGRLSDAEAEAAASFLASRARRTLKLSVDDESLSMQTTSVSSGGLSRVPGAAPHVSVTVVLEAALPDQEELRLGVSDRSDSPIDGNVPLNVRLEGWTLVETSSGRAEPGERDGVWLARGLRLEPGRPWSARLLRGSGPR